MDVYRPLMVLKFIGVMLYGGGMVAGLIASSLEDRKIAVHRIASPGLLLIWVVGYCLTVSLNVPLGELWILGAIVLSFVSQLALVRSVVADTRSPGIVTMAGLPVLIILVLMVFRPTWASVIS